MTSLRRRNSLPYTADNGSASGTSRWSDFNFDAMTNVPDVQYLRARPAIRRYR